MIKPPLEGTFSNPVYLILQNNFESQRPAKRVMSIAHLGRTNDSDTVALAGPPRSELFVRVSFTIDERDVG